VNAWKVILSTLVIFIAGVVTGGLLVTYALQVRQNRPKPPNSANVQAASPWGVRNKELLRRMDRELELTPEQHVRIDSIMSTSEERTKSLWKPIMPLMSKETQLVRAEIRDLLNADQKKKFDDFGKGRPGQEKRRFTNSGPASITNSILTNLVPTNLPATNP
jgi:hypothetical protein